MATLAATIHHTVRDWLNSIVNLVEDSSHTHTLVTPSASSPRDTCDILNLS